MPFRDSLWMPLTAKTVRRHQSREARNKRPAFFTAERQLLPARKADWSGVSRERSGRRSREKPAVGVLFWQGVTWFGLPRLDSFKSAEGKTNGGTWGRGRYGTLPVRMGSRARSSGEGKTFPARSPCSKTGTRLQPEEKSSTTRIDGIKYRRVRTSHAANLTMLSTRSLIHVRPMGMPLS